MAGTAPIYAQEDPELRKRNIRLGLIVGGFVVLVMALAFGRFVIWGLPQDRDTYEKQQQRQSIEQGAAESAEDAVHE